MNMLTLADPATQTAMEGFLSNIGTFFSQCITWLGTCLNTITGMIEYGVCAIILCVTIASAFKFLRALVK